jgi:hypothetical protein
MDQREINKRLEAIAKFMGGKWDSLNVGGEPCIRFRMPDMHITEWFTDFENNVPYNSDWSLIMEVVEKIESMGFEIDICKNTFLIMNSPEILKSLEPITIEKLPLEKRYESQIKGSTKKDAAFIGISDFCLNHKAITNP